MKNHLWKLLKESRMIESLNRKYLINEKLKYKDIEGRYDVNKMELNRKLWFGIIAFLKYEIHSSRKIFFFFE